MGVADRRGWWRASLVGLALVFSAIALDLGRPLPEDGFASEEARQVLDAKGGVLAQRVVPHRGHDRWVELDAAAPVVLDALITAEDRRFYWHPGVDPLAILRATRVNLRHGRAVQGGSTLTQQTARLYQARPAGLWGKLVEARWALRLDLHLSKEEILTHYLNRAYFGRGAWGIEAAAKAWFDETAASLSVAEAVALVSLLPSPDNLSPDGDRQASERRRRGLLDQMVARGVLTAEAAQRAREEPLQVRRRGTDGMAPHLGARLLQAHAEPAVLQTTVDPRLQAQVERIVEEVIGRLRRQDVDHAAVLVVDAQTDAVLAYVGSANFHAEDGQNDGVQARRSSGSAIKPFLYAMAFERGRTPADVLQDLPRRWSNKRGSWAPQNYSETFRGPVLGREALASSLNLPAVQILDEVGVSNAMAWLQEAGVHFPRQSSHYGLGMAVGGTETTLQELVSLYAIFARGGLDRPLRFLASEPQGEARRLIDPLASWMVTDILADPVARVAGFGRGGPLSRRYPVAVKTGTSAGFRDNWTVGYTPRHVVGVWVGNFDGRPMGEVSGVTGAGPIWAEVFDEVSRLYGTGPLHERPRGLEVRAFCALSGEPAGPNCPHRTDEVVRVDHPHAEPCTWHPPGCEVAWPSAFRTWAEDQGRLDEGGGCPTTGWVGIAAPIDGAVLYIDPTLPPDHQRVALRAAAPSGAQQARWRVDGELVASVEGSLRARWAPPGPGVYRIALEVDGVSADPVTVRVTGGVQPELR